MTPPQTPPDAGWHEWLKLIVPGAFVAGVVFLWGVVRPGVARLIFYFLEHRDARLHFKKYLSDTMPELGVTIETTASAVRTLQSTTREIAETQQRQHGENTSTSEQIKDDLHGFGEEMKKVTQMLGRIEGREDARYNQRRDRDDR